MSCWTWESCFATGAPVEAERGRRWPSSRGRERAGAAEQRALVGRVMAKRRERDGRRLTGAAPGQCGDGLRRVRQAHPRGGVAAALVQGREAARERRRAAEAMVEATVASPLCFERIPRGPL